MTTDQSEGLSGCSSLKELANTSENPRADYLGKIMQNLKRVE